MLCTRSTCSSTQQAIKVPVLQKSVSRHTPPWHWCKSRSIPELRGREKGDRVLQALAFTLISVRYCVKRRREREREREREKREREKEKRKRRSLDQGSAAAAQRLLNFFMGTRLQGTNHDLELAFNSGGALVHGIKSVVRATETSLWQGTDRNNRPLDPPPPPPPIYSYILLLSE